MQTFNSPGRALMISGARKVNRTGRVKEDRVTLWRTAI